MLFKVGLVPFIMTSGCALGRPGRQSLAPLKRERREGIKQRDSSTHICDCCTEICESHPQICRHIEDTYDNNCRGHIISPTEHLSPIHYSPLRALNSSHTCVVHNAQGWPLSYCVRILPGGIIALSGRGGPKDHRRFHAKTDRRELHPMLALCNGLHGGGLCCV